MARLHTEAESNAAIIADIERLRLVLASLKKRVDEARSALARSCELLAATRALQA